MNGGHMVGNQGRTSDYRPGYEITAERILAHIAEQGLGPGDRLPTEQQWCEILGVTRSVAREAVKVLSALGRISVRKGAGLFVADGRGGLAPVRTPDFQPSNLEHVAMMFDYRLAIETEAARRAADRASPAEVRAIRDAAQRTADAATQDDFDSFRAADEQFHRAIGAAAHNMFLADAVDQVTQLKRQVLTIGLRGSASGSLTAAATEHLEIAQAIGDGDPDRAVSAMAQHVNVARGQFQDRITNRLREIVRADGEG